MGETLIKSKGNLSAGMAGEPSGELQLGQGEGQLMGLKPALAKDFIHADRVRAEQAENFFTGRGGKLGPRSFLRGLLIGLWTRTRYKTRHKLGFRINCGGS